MSSAAKPLITVSRPPFLILSLVLVAAGTAASAYDGAMHWLNAVLALVGLTALHAGVNAINEAADMHSGIDLHTERTPFSGGTGTLPAGLLSVRAAAIWGLLATAVGLGIGIWFLLQLGLIVLPFIVLAAFSVLAYTHILLRIGLGEFFAGLGLGALPIAGVSLVQDGKIGAAAIAVAIPAFCMTFNLLLLNEFPDEKADRIGKRKHLVILLGRRGAAIVYSMVAIAAPVSIVTSVLLDVFPPIALAAVVPALLLIPVLRWALAQPEKPVPLSAMGNNVVWNLATNVLLAASLGAAVWRGW